MTLNLNSSSGLELSPTKDVNTSRQKIGGRLAPSMSASHYLMGGINFGSGNYGGDQSFISGTRSAISGGLANRIG